MIETPSWNSRKDDGIYKVAGAAQLKKYGQFCDKLYSSPQLENSSLDYIIEGPIRLVYKAEEDVSLLTLAESENKTYTKLLATVAGTCQEIRLLKQESSSFHCKLFSHGERSEQNSNINDLLSDLQDLSVYVTRVTQVLNLTIKQLSKLSDNTFEIYLPSLIEHAVDAFTILVVLDEIIESQPSIVEQWKKYRVQVRSVAHNCMRTSIPEGRLGMFEKLLKDLYDQLLCKKLFSKSLEGVMDVVSSSLTYEHFVSYLKNAMTEIESRASDSHLLNKSWTRVNVGIVVAAKLFGNCDKKLLKRLLEVNKKLFAVSLVGNVVWIPTAFLETFLPREGIAPVTSQMGEKVLAMRTQKLGALLGSVTLRSILWCVQARATLGDFETRVSDIEKKRVLIQEVLMIVKQINETVTFVTNMHAYLSKPMTRGVVKMLCQLTEVQKSLEIVFYSMSPVVVQAQSQVVQQLSYQLLSILENVRKSLTKMDRVYSKERLDALCLVGLSMRLVDGPGTANRRVLIKCALACASQLTDSFKEDDVLKLKKCLDNLDLVVELHEQMCEACDYSVLLHHQSMIPAYFASTANENVNVKHLVHLLGAYNSAILKVGRSDLTEARVREMRASLRENILEPICREIETSLRLHVHSHLKLDSTNPFKIGVKDGNRIVRSSQMPIEFRIVCAKRFVENYLDDMFYNLTTVALHDWKTYRTMHALANFKLGLETVQNHLPTQTLEQGLDALEIMRNIHVFVSKYLYNLHTQTFIEHTSNNKHLNAIGIRHIANSIRTHGTGIMSTTVNFVYQFLRMKLHTFSQFLFDDHIKSRLMRDIRYVKAQREKDLTPYTYERAEKFQKGIRKLGMTADGLSYLDQFRQLITQIGNALGYVRLIRSGGLHACSNAISFLPDINSSASFETMCKALNYPETTQVAAKRLENDIGNLVRNFTEGIQYFKILVDVFASAFRDAKCYHLQQFYVIVPPLTLSFVDNAVSNKEKLFKKNKTGAAFTDDGFAMGVAYITALLDQGHELDGLQWFKTVDEYSSTEKASAEKKGEHEDEKLQQARALTLKRLSERSAEFRLLYYSLSGARVFFKQPDS